jgi:transcription elongation factor Elf1
MNHPPAEFIETTRKTSRLRRPFWRCPVCGKTLPGNQKPKPCTGRDEAMFVAPIAGGGLDCVHRLEKVGTVPCGICPQAGTPKQAAVYLCKAEGGRACVLYPIGNGPEQKLHEVRPVVCATCPIRTPHSNLER